MGSGCNPAKGHCGRPKTKDEDRANRAKTSHKPSFRYKTERTARNEAKLAKTLGAKQVGGQAPFDVVHMRYRMGIEVKTLVEARNDKLTIHPASLARKLKEAKQEGIKTTVVVAFDDRPGKGQIYYKIGLGSFRLTSMTKVKNLNDLKKQLGVQ